MKKNIELEGRATRYNNRRKNGEKFDFEDFKFCLLDINDEFTFTYNNRLFEIVWNPNGIEFYKDQNADYSKEDYEFYATGEELLANAKIDGRHLYEIAEEIDMN